MIFEKLDKSLDNKYLKRVSNFVKEHDFSNEECGMHEISEGFFYNLIEYSSTTPDERDWESHKDFLDIHVVFEGNERIYHNFSYNMKSEGYDKDSDWAQWTGDKLNDIVLQKGDILLFDTEDVHKTALIYKNKEKIRKAVFKIKI
ncbi:MAG: YhcH/YjgK/YiaL family protein [Tissierellia bacterium]|nr:YhcH/YjgK/YiaL family protein [Tissierellia bacterium]